MPQKTKYHRMPTIQIQIQQQFHVAPATPAHHFGGYSKTHYRKLFTHVESHVNAVSLLESRE